MLLRIVAHIVARPPPDRGRAFGVRHCRRASPSLRATGSARKGFFATHRFGTSEAPPIRRHSIATGQAPALGTKFSPTWCVAREVHRSRRRIAAGLSELSGNQRPELQRDGHRAQPRKVTRRVHSRASAQRHCPDNPPYEPSLERFGRLDFVVARNAATSRIGC